MYGNRSNMTRPNTNRESIVYRQTKMNAVIGLSFLLFLFWPAAPFTVMTCTNSISFHSRLARLLGMNGSGLWICVTQTTAEPTDRSTAAATSENDNETAKLSKHDMTNNVWWWVTANDQQIVVPGTRQIRTIKMLKFVCRFTINRHAITTENNITEASIDHQWASNCLISSRFGRHICGNIEINLVILCVCAMIGRPSTARAQAQHWGVPSRRCLDCLLFRRRSVRNVCIFFLTVSFLASAAAVKVYSAPLTWMDSLFFLFSPDANDLPHLCCIQSVLVICISWYFNTINMVSMSIYIICTSADDPINTLNVNRTHVISWRFRVIILVRLVLQSLGDSCNGFFSSIGVHCMVYAWGLRRSLNHRHTQMPHNLRHTLIKCSVHALKRKKAKIVRIRRDIEILDVVLQNSLMK